MNHDSLENHMPNGLDSDHSSTSLNSFDDIESDPPHDSPHPQGYDDFMNLENIDMAISHVSSLLAFDRNVNGMVLPRDDLDATVVRGVEANVSRERQMNSLCEELLQLFLTGDNIYNVNTRIPEETARQLIQWLLRYIPEEKQSDLIRIPSISPLSSRTNPSVGDFAGHNQTPVGSITRSKSTDKSDGKISNTPQLSQIDSDCPSNTTSTSGLNDFPPHSSRIRPDPNTAYLTSSLPRQFRDRCSTTPASCGAGVGYLSENEDSIQHKRSYTLSKDNFFRVESMGVLGGQEYPNDYLLEGMPPRPNTSTPEPWLSIEDETPIFKRGGSLRRISKAIGKLRKASSRDKVVILGSSSNMLVIDQPHRREFLSKDVKSLQEWLTNLGMEQYCAKIGQEKINSCALLKIVIDGKLDTVLSLSHPLHRKKLELALEETLKYGKTDLTRLDYKWVLNWLEMNGLMDLCPKFEEARIDGRMLYMLTYDDLTLLQIEEPFYQLNLKAIIKVLRLTGFAANYLDSREFDDNCLYWSSPHVQDWVSRTLKLYNNERLKKSGLNGAIMMLEETFTASTLAEILDIPKGKTHLRSVVREEFMKVIGPHCAQHKIDKAKVKNFVHLSPSNIKPKKKGSIRLNAKGAEKKIAMKDGTRLLCPLVFEPNSNSPCFQGNLSVFQGLIDTYIYSSTDLDTLQLEISEHDSTINTSQKSHVMVTNEDGDILV